jgi:hypothetical protein
VHRENEMRKNEATDLLHLAVVLSHALLCVLVTSVRCEASLSDYGWTLSGSSTDPLVSEGADADTLSLYLWLYCAQPVTGGVATSKFGVETSGVIEYVEFFPKPGVVNSGSGTVLDLALSGCPSGAFLAGGLRIAVVGSSYWVSVGPGEPIGDFVTVGCDLVEPGGSALVGYAVGGADVPAYDVEFFFLPGKCKPTTSVEGSTWGGVKARYHTR